MPIIPIIVVVFGAAGTILALYLRFTVKSPILQTEDGKDVDTRGAFHSAGHKPLFYLFCGTASGHRADRHSFLVGRAIRLGIR